MKFPMGLILLSRLDDGSLPRFHFELGTSTINTIRKVWSEDDDVHIRKNHVASIIILGPAVQCSSAKKTSKIMYSLDVR